MADPQRDSTPPSRTPRERLRRVMALQWPRDYPLVQFPNAPLLVFIATVPVRLLAGGRVEEVAEAVGLLALTAWAYDELARGDNAVRRVLGLSALGLIAIRVADLIHR